MSAAPIEVVAGERVAIIAQWGRAEKGTRLFDDDHGRQAGHGNMDGYPRRPSLRLLSHARSSSSTLTRLRRHSQLCSFSAVVPGVPVPGKGNCITPHEQQKSKQKQKHQRHHLHHHHHHHHHQHRNPFSSSTARSNIVALALLPTTSPHPAIPPVTIPSPSVAANTGLQGTTAVPTASHAGPSAHKTPTPAVTANPRIPSPSFQPPYPSPPDLPLPFSSPSPQVRISSPTRWSLRNAFIGAGNPEFASPFRNRSETINSLGALSITQGRGRPRRPSAARSLWNPSNSTPRVHPRTPKRHHSPPDRRPVIAVPLDHPDLHSPTEGAGAGGEYPLLTLPEQRRSRHSGSTRASLQVERSASSTGTNRISLPRSVSIDLQRRSGEITPTPTRLDKGKGKEIIEEEGTRRIDIERRPTTGYRKRGQSIAKPTSAHAPGLHFHKDKGKGRDMSTDLERGPDTQGSYQQAGISNLPHHESRPSLDAGIGPALSATSTDSSIMGEEGPAGDPAEEWGPQHPCYPHMNPHVPITSPLYQTTRIIRIRRDWMLEGDLAPTFSNLYPEILDPAGVSEQDFRGLIERINRELTPAFDPWGLRNVLDTVLGLVTGWIWDDLGFTAVKGRLRRVEEFLEQWNREMEGRSKEGVVANGGAPRVVPLRRTGYMNLDIQVPDPEISYPNSIPPEEMTNTGLSRISQ